LYYTAPEGGSFSRQVAGTRTFSPLHDATALQAVVCSLFITLEVLRSHRIKRRLMPIPGKMWNGGKRSIQKGG
ncbi:MAG: hypothetical protein ACREQO_01770, partial [Candidatus Binatia bacterium]